MVEPAPRRTVVDEMSPTEQDVEQGAMEMWLVWQHVLIAEDWIRVQPMMADNFRRLFRHEYARRREAVREAVERAAKSLDEPSIGAKEG